MTYQVGFIDVESLSNSLLRIYYPTREEGVSFWLPTQSSWQYVKGYGNKKIRSAAQLSTMVYYDIYIYDPPVFLIIFFSKAADFFIADDVQQIILVSAKFC